LFLFFLLIFFFFLFQRSPTHAAEWSGYVAGEGRLFFNDAIHAGQRDQQASVAAQPEFYHAWEESSFTFVPFARLDSADSERSHADLRELFYLWYPGDFDLSFGVRKVFWGVTESQHLVDIINQTDLVELPDGEEKLGQPMVSLSILRDWGVLDLFVLSYFRERTFPGRRGRLRGPLPIDTDQARYESGAKEYHLDFALRFTKTLGDWDIGLSHFQGTGREPTLLLETDASGNAVLIPFYEQIDQSGLEVQRVMDAWLWKLELIHRIGQGDSFQAWTGGFEYTFTAISETKMDLGVIGEWLYDTRDDMATTPFEDDLMLGMRLTVNDMDSTELLVGLIQDLDHPSQLLRIEASRRFGDHWKMEVEGSVFAQQRERDFLYAQRDDDFLQITLFYYF